MKFIKGGDGRKVAAVDSTRDCADSDAHRPSEAVEAPASRQADSAIAQVSVQQSKANSQEQAAHPSMEALESKGSCAGMQASSVAAQPALSRAEVDCNTFGKFYWMLHTSIYTVRRMQAGKTKDIRIEERCDVVGDFLAAMAERKTLAAIYRPLKARGVP